jgi:hypothetical protein
MSAEVLREAAALMRERAEAATEGPWSTYVDPHDDPIVVDQYGLGVQSAVTYDVVCYSGQVYSRDAEHIASWHPAAALAVADWLEATAAENNSPEDSALGFLNFITADSHAALAVARTYLGSDS